MIPDLYNQYFIAKDDERKEMFELLKEKYQPAKGLYPGSFVHITPSFFIEEMVYVDSDRRMRKFFEDPDVSEFIQAHKVFPEPALHFALLQALSENRRHTCCKQQSR